jgi:hypothetical protein
MAIYIFVPHNFKAKFCGMPSRAILKAGCAVGEKRMRNTAPDNQTMSEGYSAFRHTVTVTAKAVPLHAMEALGGRGGIAPTHSRPRH